MLLFCLRFPLKIYKVRAWQYIILVVLLVLLFGPLQYSYTDFEGGTSVTHSEMRFTSLIRPVTFLILMLFLVFNYRTMVDLYLLLIRGPEKEQEEELSKEIAFYYTKFNACSNSELVDICKMDNDYPVGAQLALNRIKKGDRLKGAENGI